MPSTEEGIANNAYIIENPQMKMQRLYKIMVNYEEDIYNLGTVCSNKDIISLSYYPDGMIVECLFILRIIMN